MIVIAGNYMSIERNGFPSVSLVVVSSICVGLVDKSIIQIAGANHAAVVRTDAGMDHQIIL